MCGRFTQNFTWHEIRDLHDLVGAARNVQAHYNIAPTDTVEVVRPTDKGGELVPMRWGLIPVWWKKPLKQLPATFNGRAESVTDKPMFRDAFRRRRCVVPASGYYEWLKRPDGKQPYFLSASDGGVMSVAGLWDAAPRDPCLRHAWDCWASRHGNRARHCGPDRVHHPSRLLP